MRRRQFITLLGGAATGWPLAARAQPKPPTIGFLGPASASVMSAWAAAFAQRLRELGWIEGRTIAIEYAGRMDAPTASPSLRPSWSGSAPASSSPPAPVSRH